MSSSSPAADAPGRANPGSEPASEPAAPSGEEAGPAAHPGPGGSDGGAGGSRTRRRRLVRNVTVLAVAAAAVAGAIVVFAGHPAPAPSAGSAGAGAARPFALADEAAATVAVVKTGGAITGGPVNSRDGQLWLVEASQATGQPMLTVVNPVSYAVSTHPLPASLGGLSLRYTGAEAFDNLGQLWLGATATSSGKQPAGILVRYTPAGGAIAQFSLGGNCSDDSAAQPAQLFTASDGGVWVECPATQDSAETFIARLAKDGTFTVPSVSPVNRALLGTRLWAQIAALSQAKIGPLVAGPGGAMWGSTTAGFVQIAATGAEVLTAAGPVAIEMQTEAEDTVESLQLAGNAASDAPDFVGGVGECRAVGAPAGQARQCAVSVDSFGNVSMLAAAPDDIAPGDGATAHPAGLDASGDVWFIVNGTAGGQAPQGQYFFEANPGGGSRIIPFTVPGDARPVPAGQVPVISMNGAVWTADPQLGPGTLVGVMPKN